MSDSNIIAIVGPTAVGKSALAMNLADSLGGEILSADSMQVYVGLDIGTAKPSLEERRRIRHWMTDVVKPQEPFSVGEFLRLAGPVLSQAVADDRPLVICGGTGLYLKAIAEGLAEVPPPDFQFREEMEGVAEEKGTLYLHERLMEIDPNAAELIHPNDRKRIIRALEIHHSTGISKTHFEQGQPTPPWAGKTRWFGLSREREDLDDRINRRVSRMFEAGLIEEVQNLLKKGCDRSKTSMQGLGYKEVLEHLDGERSLDETIQLIQRKTRRFARRQMSWFRMIPGIEWIRLSRDGFALPDRAVPAEVILDQLAVKSKNFGPMKG